MKKLALLFVALFCVSAFTDDLPRIAVYVTGDVPNNEKEALGTRILTSLVNSGRYIAIERSKSFLAEIEKEHVKQRSGDIDDNQISALGKQFGVKFVCIAAITPAFGDFQVSARIVDVETAVVVYIGDASSPLKSMDDLERVSDQVVKNMFSGKAKAAPKPKPEPKPKSTPEPAHNTEQYTLPANSQIYENFTDKQRWLALTFNCLAPGTGLGSIAVMNDGWGAATQWILTGSGLILLFIGIDKWQQEYDIESNIEPEFNAFIYTGIVVGGIDVAYMILRPLLYKKKSKNIASLENSGLNVAVLPDQDGNIKGYVAYRMEF